MPDLFDRITRHFWLIALLFTAFNTFSYRHGLTRLTQSDPNQARRYVPWPYGFILLNTVIWLTMGIGTVIGRVPSAFDYFDPSVGNPYVIAWHGVLVSSWLLTCLWVFVGRGAQFTVDHPGLFFIAPATANAVRIQFAIGLFGGLWWEVLMWSRYLTPAHR